MPLQWRSLSLWLDLLDSSFILLVSYSASSWSLTAGSRKADIISVLEADDLSELQPSSLSDDVRLFPAFRGVFE
jgi:hypothetical protein